MWIRDPRDNKKSVSVTLLIYVTVLAMAKWILADKFLGKCDASDVAMIVGPFLTSYFAQRSVWSKAPSDTNTQQKGE